MISSVLEKWKAVVSMKLDNNNHSVFLLYYHLVLVVKYRRQVIDDTISDYAKDMFVRLAWIRDKDAFKLPRKLDQSTNIALGLLHLIGEHSELSWYFGMIGFSNIFDTLLSRIQDWVKITIFPWSNGITIWTMCIFCSKHIQIVNYPSSSMPIKVQVLDWSKSIFRKWKENCGKNIFGQEAFACLQRVVRPLK